MLFSWANYWTDQDRQGTESHLSSWRTAAAWEAFCCEFKKVAGIPNLRLSVII